MKILIAEDDITTRLVLGATLKKLGHDVTAAADGQEAWNALNKEHFPLLISDWMMPNMDGLELCRLVRADNPAQYTYIILLTALAGKASYLDGMDAGADDFITKPFDEDQLAARLRVADRILALHESLRAANQDLEQRVQARTSELIAANVQLEASRDLAEAGSRAKSEFLSRMSHELRTPLNAILGFGQILQAGQLSTIQSDSVKEIMTAGYRLLAFVNEMLDLTRVETGAPTLELSSVDIGALLREELDEVRSLARVYDVELNIGTMDVGIKSSLVVLADRSRLKQVIHHLLSNAIKFNHGNGKVTLGCVVMENRLRIEVRDTGPGIAPESMEKLFRPFERLDAEERNRAGVGSGLALAKWLIEAMGGQIIVESTVGQGSVFCILLPLSSP